MLQAKRIDFLDVMKGFGIISVVLCHISEANAVDRWFGASIQVGIFFFVSGMLFKNMSSKEFVRKRVKNLLVPYLFFAACSFVYWALFERWFRSAGAYMTVTEGLMGIFVAYFPWLFFNGTLWFLIGLFVTSLIFLLIFKTLKGNKYLLPIAICALAYLGTIIRFKELPFTLNRAAWFIIFYAFGYYYGEIKLNIYKAYSMYYEIAAFAVALAVYVVVNLSILHYSGFGSYIVIGLQILFVLYVSRFIAAKDRLLKYLGNHSLIILCMHGPVYRALIGVTTVVLPVSVVTIRNNFWWSLLITVIVIAICLVCEIFFAKYVPEVIGRQRNKAGELSVV